MTRTRAVRFDFGGTLAFVGLEPIVRATVLHFAAVHGIRCAPETLIAALAAAAAQANRSVAARPFYLFRDAFQEGFRLTFERFGATLSADHAAEMHRFLRGQIAGAEVRVNDGARETLAALRERGLRLGIVSNADQDEFTALLGASGLGDAADFALSEVGMVTNKEMSKLVIVLRPVAEDKKETQGCGCSCGCGCGCG